MNNYIYYNMNTPGPVCSGPCCAYNCFSGFNSPIYTADYNGFQANPVYNGFQANPVYNGFQTNSVYNGFQANSVYNGFQASPVYHKPAYEQPYYQQPAYYSLPVNNGNNPWQQLGAVPTSNWNAPAPKHVKTPGQDISTKPRIKVDEQANHAKILNILQDANVAYTTPDGNFVNPHAISFLKQMQSFNFYKDPSWVKVFDDLINGHIPPASDNFAGTVPSDHSQSIEPASFDSNESANGYAGIARPRVNAQKPAQAVIHHVLPKTIAAMPGTYINNQVPQDIRDYLLNSPAVPSPVVSYPVGVPAPLAETIPQQKLQQALVPNTLVSMIQEENDTCIPQLPFNPEHLPDDTLMGTLAEDSLNQNDRQDIDTASDAGTQWGQDFSNLDVTPNTFVEVRTQPDSANEDQISDLVNLRNIAAPAGTHKPNAPRKVDSSFFGPMVQSVITHSPRASDFASKSSAAAITLTPSEALDFNEKFEMHRYDLSNAVEDFCQYYHANLGDAKSWQELAEHAEQANTHVNTDADQDTKDNWHHYYTNFLADHSRVPVSARKTEVTNDLENFKTRNP